MRRAGRLHAPAVDALAANVDGMIELRAPQPGRFVPALAAGDLVSPGGVIGELVVLGRAIAIVVPRATAAGIAIRVASAPHAVGYGEAVVAIDPSLEQRAAGATGEAAAAAGAAPTIEGLVFRAPTSGRFYGRSAPDKPPFVVEGAQLARGATICLLEVMKTFHRVTYGGAGLPDTARIRKLLVQDGADVNAGDPLLALE
jgi:acetyl-CoA carboxylase biotin carboxyl carrier protein